MRAFIQVREAVHRVAGALRWLPPMLARVALGAVFLESGWGKLTNLDKVVAFFAQLGIPAPAMAAPLVAVVEFVGGALLLVGCFTRVASLPLAFTMTVAIATAKRAELNGATDLFGMSEFLYLVLFAYLFVEGAGPASVDRVLRQRLLRGGAGSAVRKAA